MEETIGKGLIMNYFITPKELESFRQEKGYIEKGLKRSLVILDARGGALGHDGKDVYEAGHIPGAYPVSAHDVTGPLHPLGHGGRHPLGDIKKFASLLESYGVSNETEIVLYDDWASMMGRVWFVLRYMGFEKIRVLSGGITRWAQEGLPLESGVVPLPQEKGRITISLQDHLLVEFETVRKLSETKEKILLDVRAPERYRGEVEPLDTVAGHIPSALNLFYNDLFTKDGIIPVEEIEEKIRPLKEDGRDVVVYCGSGITAPIGMIALEAAGLSTSLYLGSFSDWIAHDDAVVAIGEETLQ